MYGPVPVSGHLDSLSSLGPMHTGSSSSSSSQDPAPVSSVSGGGAQHLDGSSFAAPARLATRNAPGAPPPQFQPPPQLGMRAREGWRVICAIGTCPAAGNFLSAVWCRHGMCDDALPLSRVPGMAISNSMSCLACFAKTLAVAP
jgi:hypothetical protein